MCPFGQEGSLAISGRGREQNHACLVQSILDFLHEARPGNETLKARRKPSVDEEELVVHGHVLARMTLLDTSTLAECHQARCLDLGKPGLQEVMQ
jgi:hypothetical protein